ncbi:hypothetical protein ACINKY_10900 [Paenibacillus illinoisensis]|uniref:DUF4367 domain-containing protein n=1 Tax=Paenibacillus illinoisensis TaxID=59845 RepID=A0ABW8HSR6_9BACL
MSEINQTDIKHAIHNNIKSSHSSVLFENVWEQYSNKKIRYKHKRIYRKGLIAACILGLLFFFVVFQTPVRAFIEQYLEIKIIKNVKNAEIGFSWADTAGDTRFKVSNKKEAEKSLGISIPWPHQLEKKSGEKEVWIRKKSDKPLGYDYFIRTQDRYYQVIANYNINRQPEFFAKTTDKVVVKELSIQGGSAKFITSTEFNHVPYIYLEKDNWKIVVIVTNHAKENIINEQEIQDLASSIK